MTLSRGSVLWITGLPGAGKSLFAKEISCQLNDLGRAHIFLDGDQLRDIFDFRDKESYTPVGREKIAMGYGRLCQLLSSQGHLVICATVSMFHSVRDWNRQNLIGYLEVFLNPEKEILLVRNQKGLYSEGEIGIAGIRAEFPENPDFNLCMKTEDELSDNARRVIQQWLEKTKYAVV